MRHPTQLHVMQRDGKGEAEVTARLELRDGYVVGDEQVMHFFASLDTDLRADDLAVTPLPEDGEAYLVGCWAGLRGTYMFGSLVDAAGEPLSREEGLLLFDWWARRLIAEATEIVPGDSQEQRRVEAYLIAELGSSLGVALEKTRRAQDGSVVEFDGFCEAPPVLAEAWAHQGKPKSAQKFKVLADALKMVWAASAILPGARKVLVLSDEAAADHFRGRSWMARALEDLGVEIVVISLPDDLRQEIAAAQERQGRDFRGRGAGSKA